MQVLRRMIVLWARIAAIDGHEILNKARQRICAELLILQFEINYRTILNNDLPKF